MSKIERLIVSLNEYQIWVLLAVLSWVPKQEQMTYVRTSVKTSPGISKIFNGHKNGINLFCGLSDLSKIIHTNITTKQLLNSFKVNEN